MGFVLVAFTSVIFFAINADTESSWLFKIFVWLFLSIFFLSGIALLLNAPMMAYRIISAKPTLLAFDKNSLRNKHQLAAKGYIPRYADKEKRKGIDLKLICYKITPPAHDDGMRKVDKPIDTIITEHMSELKSPDFSS